MIYYGDFLKYGYQYPQIIHFQRDFHREGDFCQRRVVNLREITWSSWLVVGFINPTGTQQKLFI